MLLVFVFFTYKCKVFNKNVKILERERERERVNVCGKKTWPISSTFDFSIKKNPYLSIHCIFSLFNSGPVT